MADLAQMCAEELHAMGYQNITTSDPTLLCERYLNALYRRVQPRKRNFHISRQLQVPSDMQAGFELLKKKVEDGDDLTPHLSGLLDKLEYNDPLLNAWRIHHFHLGTQPYQRNANLVERTGPILLAMVHDDDFYAITIASHGRDGQKDLFYDLDLIEILHENFPAMMKPFKIDGWATTPKPTNEEVKLARDNGINLFSQTNDGSLYLPSPGFTSVGGTTKQTGLRVVYDAMLVVNSVRALERLIRDKIEALEICFSKQGARPYRICLTGFLNNGYVTAREESSYIGMQISVLKGPECLDVWQEIKPDSEP
jgi:hypothetical protein